MKTYYDILEVSSQASTEVIIAAHRALSKKYHPDVCKESNALERMQELNNAKEILSDEYKRKAYDEKIKVNTNETYNQYTNKAKETYTPNTDIKIFHAEFNGHLVTYQIYSEQFYVHVKFSTQDSQTFEQIKSYIKLQCHGKWNQDTKFWRCPSEMLVRMMKYFKIIKG